MAFSLKQRWQMIRALRIAANHQPGISEGTRAEARRLASISERLLATTASREAAQQLANIVSQGGRPAQE